MALRASQKSKSGVPKKEHGSSGDGTATDAPSQQSKIDLADIPSTVPELPNAYLVRDEDLSQLKVALLAAGATSGTALTSKKQQQQNKVGAHGMVSIKSLKLQASLFADDTLCLMLPCIIMLHRGVWARRPSRQPW